MLKKVGYVVGTIVVLVVVVAIGLQFYFTSDRLKSMTEPAIEEAIGRDVQIGEMSLEFIQTFPGIGVSMSDFFIPGLRQDTAASFQEIVIGFDILPLLRDQINITELVIRRPVMNYIVYEDGSSTFDFETTEEESAPADTAASQMNLNVPVVNIYEARFRYSDHTSNTNFIVDQLSGTVGLSYADLIETSLDLNIGSIDVEVEGTKYITGLPLTIQETSTIDMDKEVVTLKKGGVAVKGLQVDLNGTISQWSGGEPALDLKFQSSSDQFGELLKLVPESYQEEIGSFEAGGSLTFAGTVKGSITEKELPAIDAQLDVTDAFLQNPDLKERIQNINIKASITNKQISLTAFNAEAGGNSIKADGVINNPLEEKPIVQLKASTRVDLATVPDFYPIDTDTLDMRGKLHAEVVLNGPITDIQKALQSGTFTLANGYLSYHKLGKPVENIEVSGRIEGKRLQLDKFNLKSGSNTLAATGRISNFQSDNPSVDLSVKGNIDFADLPSYYSLEPYITKIAGTADADLTIRGPVNTPENLRLDGTMQIKNAEIAGDSLPTAPISNLNADVRLKQSTITANSMTMNIGPSDISFQGSVDQYMEFAKEKMARSVEIKGDLTSKFLNYDAMFPVADVPAEEETEPIPMDIPNIIADLKVKADSIIYMGTGFYDASADVRIVQDKITVSNAKSGIMGGLATGNLVWNIPDPLKTNLVFKGKVDSVAFGRFFREFQVLGEESSIYNHLSGDFSAVVDYSTEMDQYLEPEIPTTKAKGHFGMTESRLENHPAQLALARFLKANELRQMDLDEWQADYTISKGVMELRNMKLSSGNLAMELEGTQNLMTNKLNYKATLWVPQKYAGNLASIISERGVKALTEEDGRVKLPLRITGTTEDVTYRPDQEVIKDLLDEFLKDNIKNKIGNIFGKGGGG